MKDLDRLIDTLWNQREAICKRRDMGALEDDLEQAANTLRDQGAELEVLRPLYEKAANDATSNADQNMRLRKQLEKAQYGPGLAEQVFPFQRRAQEAEAEATKLRKQLEETRGELDEALEDVNQNVNWRRDTVRERDRLKVALDEIGKCADGIVPTGTPEGTFREGQLKSIAKIARQALTPQEDSSAWKERDNSQQEFLDRQVKVQQEVCEECGGSGEKTCPECEGSGVESIDAMTGKIDPCRTCRVGGCYCGTRGEGKIPCPKGCQPDHSRKQNTASPTSRVCIERCEVDIHDCQPQTPGDVIIGEGDDGEDYVSIDADACMSMPNPGDAGKEGGE